MEVMQPSMESIDAFSSSAKPRSYSFVCQVLQRRSQSQRPGQSTLLRLEQRMSRLPGIYRQRSISRLNKQLSRIDSFDKEQQQYNESRDHHSSTKRKRVKSQYPTYYEPKEDIADSVLRLFADSDDFENTWTAYTLSRSDPNSPSKKNKDVIVSFAEPYASHISHKGQILNAIKMNDVELMIHILDLCELLCKIPTHKVVNEKDQFGCPYLVSAAQYGRVELVKLLIEKGHLVHCKSYEGWTPAFAAAYHGHFECMKVLIEKAENDFGYNMFNIVTLNDINALRTKWDSPYLQQFNGKKFNEYLLLFWSKKLIKAVKSNDDVESLRVIDHILRYNTNHKLCHYVGENDGGKDDEEGNSVLHWSAKSDNSDIWNLMIKQLSRAENKNKPWILEQGLKLENKMGLSVIGYAIYCHSINILRILANKMQRTIDFGEFTQVEWEWKKRNIENIVRKQKDKTMSSREKTLKSLIRKMVKKPNVVTDPEIDAEVYKKYREHIVIKSRASINARKVLNEVSFAPITRQVSMVVNAKKHAGMIRSKTVFQRNTKPRTTKTDDMHDFILEKTRPNSIVETASLPLYRESEEEQKAVERKTIAKSRLTITQAIELSFFAKCENVKAFADKLMIELEKTDLFKTKMYQKIITMISDNKAKFRLIMCNSGKDAMNNPRMVEAVDTLKSKGYVHKIKLATIPYFIE